MSAGGNAGARMRRAADRSQTLRFQAIDDVPSFIDELHTRMKQIPSHVFEAPLDTLGTDPLPMRLTS